MGYHSKFTEPVEQNKDCFTSCSLRQWKWSLFTWWRTYCRGRLLHHMYMTLFISFFKKIIHASFCVHMVCKCNLIQSILLETLEYLFNHDPVKLDAWHKFNSNPIHNQGGIEISLIFGHNKVKLIFLCEYFFCNKQQRVFTLCYVGSITRPSGLWLHSFVCWCYKCSPQQVVYLQKICITHRTHQQEKNKWKCCIYTQFYWW